MKIKVKSHTTETAIEIGYIKGLKKANFLLIKKRKEIEKHRSSCIMWKKAFSNPKGMYTTRINYCPKCAIGAISNVIEPLQYYLKRELFEVEQLDIVVKK